MSVIFDSYIDSFVTEKSYKEWTGTVDGNYSLSAYAKSGSTCRIHLLVTNYRRLE